ncbi:hypothetical protein AKO1_007056, partial [Acrasis kona]
MPKYETNVSVSDMESEARSWLRQINFDVLLTHRTHDHNDLIRDVLRNGVFLAELVTTLLLKQSLMKNVNVTPTRIEDARDNIELVLSMLKGTVNIPSRYLYDASAEKILRGEKDAIWGLVYYLMKCFPGSIHNTNQHYNKSKTLYPPEQMRQLEQALVFWLRSVGLCVSSDPMLTCLEMIESGMRNGVLLCDVVSFVLGEKIIGVCRSPKVAASCLSNINRSLELLRKRKSMTQEFLWGDKDVLDGNRNVILGLLEDVYRYYDHVQPRVHTGHRGAPYLGKIP